MELGLRLFRPVKQTFIYKKCHSKVTFKKLTKKLKEAGIQIRYYGDTHFEPQTRFTIIGYNKPTPQVAISRTQYTIRKRGKLNHKIYQTSMSGDERDMWINSLALDMIDLCELVSKEK